MADAIQPSAIEPNTTVQVKVVKAPTNAAAVKTLRRVLRKDPALRAASRTSQLRRARKTEGRQRRDRTWFVRPARIPVVRGEVGDEGTLLATVDVIRDLESVGRFIEITPAK